MPQEKFILEIEADVDKDGTKETGVFEMLGDVEVTEGIRTGYLIGGKGSQAFGVLSTIGDIVHGQGSPKRKGIHLDLGGGQHMFQISFRGWEGAIDPDGNALQWGDGSGSMPADATQSDPTTQVNCFMNYLRIGEIDSLRPARLTFGEYSPTGTITNDETDNHLSVVIEQPTLTRTAGQPNTYEGTLTVIETVTIDDVLDAALRPNK